MSSDFIDIDMINTESGAVECAAVICVVADRFAKISASALGVIEPCSMPRVENHARFFDFETETIETRAVPVSRDGPGAPRGTRAQ